MKKTNKSKILIMIVILIILVLLSIAFGSVNITIGDVCKILLSKIPVIGKNIDINNINQTYLTIIFNIRLPRILLSTIVGMGLAVVGSVYQGILKTNMADPYILGISSGAALGATLSIILEKYTWGAGIYTTTILSFVMAIFTIVLVYMISKGVKKSTILILVGINISSFISAIISLMMILNRDQFDKIVLWTMGSFGTSTWIKVIISSLIVIPLCIFITFFNKQINAISISEDTAKSLGVDVKRVNKTLIIITSLIVATCVSMSGIIGFVGLMVPNIVRMMFGPNHKNVIIFSMIFGGILMLLSDGIARTIISPKELPVGIITAMLGAPYLVYLVISHNRKVQL